MPKHESFMRQPPPIKREVHPIWRGIGFILIILTPIMSYFATIVMLDENSKRGWFQIPVDLLAPGTDPLLYVKILGTIVIAFVLFIIFMLITFLIYSMFGPPRYGPLDVPPQTYRGKRYKR